MTEKYKYFLNKSCFCEEIDDSLFILHSETGQYHEINGSGKQIIKILDSNKLSIDEIISYSNQSKYNFKKNDVIEFIKQLIKREIISFKE